MEHANSRSLRSASRAAADLPSAWPSLGRFAARTLVAGVLATLAASPAAAALREYRMQFQPSSTTGVTGYTMHVGTATGRYTTSFDLGLPPASGGVVNYALDLEDSVDLYVALRAYGAAGAVSAFSSEVHLTPIVASGGGTTGGGTGGTTNGGGTGGTVNSGGSGGTPNNPPGTIDPALALGLATKNNGSISRLMPNGTARLLTMDSLVAFGNVRPGGCDLDDDGDRDLVVGFGDGSDGTVAILTLENGAVVATDSIQAGTAAYRRDAGRTIPACGDIDGDGRAEIIVGFNAGMRGMVQLFDDVSTGFAPLDTAKSDAQGFMQVPVPSRFRGSIYPAAGDIDGDGRDELVFGMSNVSSGMIVVLDDLTSGLGIHPVNTTGKSWVQVEPSSTRSMSGGITVPALGDIDGDGRDEIAVGFGPGSRARVAILEDAVAGFPATVAGQFVLQTGRAGYQKNDGATRPAIGDVDGDGREELVVGFLREGDHEVQVFDDLTNMLRPMGANGGFVTSADASLTISPATAR